MPTAATIVSNILINQRPGVSPPILFGAEAVFNSTGIILTGQVILPPTAPNASVNWRAGFIQVQWVETNWASYRGRQNSDGSLIAQMGRMPARLQQACRDTLDAPVPQPVNGIFYGPPNAVWPGTNNLRYQESLNQASAPPTLTPRHRDYPSDRKALARRNSRTGQLNFLHEVQLELHFCTMLAVREPSGIFNILNHVYWNLRWQAKFQPTNFALAATTAAAWGQPMVDGHETRANIGMVSGGRPNDSRFSRVITGIQAANCNAIAYAAESNAAIRESSTWENFDVRN